MAPDLPGAAFVVIGKGASKIEGILLPPLSSTAAARSLVCWLLHQPQSAKQVPEACGGGDPPGGHGECTLHSGPLIPYLVSSATEAIHSWLKLPQGLHFLWWLQLQRLLYWDLYYCGG